MADQGSYGSSIEANVRDILDINIMAYEEITQTNQKGALAKQSRTQDRASCL